MMATIGDVARHAGVSISTVSYVLSGKRAISAETREKVERVVRELGYRPHAGARSLASKRSNAIALVAPFRADNNVPVLMQYVSAVATSARGFDHDVLLVTQEEGDSGVRRVSSSSLVDALIVMDVEADDSRLATLRTLGIPSVLIGVPDRPNGLSCIDLDRREAAALAVSHLHDLGHRRIAMLGSPPAAYERRSGYALQFLDGYTRMIASLGMDSTAHQVEPTFDAARSALERQFAEHPDTTGLIVHNEAILGSVLAVLDRMGKRVPSDVSVVAHCPDDMAENQRVSLTNVDLAASQIASLAVTMLIGKLAGDSGGETRLIAPTLTIRESTTLPRPLATIEEDAR